MLRYFKMLAFLVVELFCPTQQLFDNLFIEELPSITFVFLTTFFVDSNIAPIKYEGTAALARLSGDLIGYVALLFINTIDPPFFWKSLLEDYKFCLLLVHGSIILLFKSFERVAVNFKLFLFLLDQAFRAVNHRLQEFFQVCYFFSKPQDSVVIRIWFCFAFILVGVSPTNNIDSLLFIENSVNCWVELEIPVGWAIHFYICESRMAI